MSGIIAVADEIGRLEKRISRAVIKRLEEEGKEVKTDA